MKRIAGLYSVSAALTVAAVGILLYKNEMLGIIISCISGVLATVCMYLAVLQTLYFVEQQEKKKCDVEEAHRKDYLKGFIENTDRLCDCVQGLVETQNLQKQEIVLAINSLAVQTVEVADQQNKLLEKQFEMINAKIQFINNGVAQTILESDQKSEENCLILRKELQSMSTRIDQLFESHSVKASEHFEKALQSRQIMLEEIGNIATCVLGNQTESQEVLKKMLPEIEDISNSFGDTLTVLEKLRKQQEKVVVSVTTTAKEIQDTMTSLSFAIEQSSEAFDKTMNGTVAEYARISDMDAKLIDKVLAKK